MNSRTRWFPLLQVILGIALMCCASASVWGKKKMSTKCVGHYNVEFRGYLNGIGSADVTQNQISITGTLKDKSGASVQVSLQLQISEDGHILDSSYAGQVAMSVQGRVDPDAKNVKVPRVNCTYRTSNNHFGRIVGHQ